tara:strand:+ start:344 stop:589 length:246 start_codon:yes stop_codon:yes gene_type:complete
MLQQPQQYEHILTPKPHSHPNISSISSFTQTARERFGHGHVDGMDVLGTIKDAYDIGLRGGSLHGDKVCARASTPLRCLYL